MKNFKWKIAWYIFVNYELSKLPNFIANWVYKNVGL